MTIKIEIVTVALPLLESSKLVSYENNPERLFTMHYDVSTSMFNI